MDVTVEELAEFHRLDADRKEFDRKSRSIEARLKPLREKFLAYLTAEQKLHVRRGGYEVQVTDGPPYVAWLEQFVRVAGQEAADRVKAATPPSKRISVVALGT